MNSKDNKSLVIGHRKRLKEKISTSSKSLNDYELLEALLFYVFPRKDTKRTAKELLFAFKSLKNVIFAEDSEVKKIAGLGESTATLFTLMKEIFSRILQNEITNNPVISTSKHVQNYYKSILGTLKKEQLRVMFLNSKNKLILEQIMQEGTINQTAIYPREIIQVALNCGASALILVHNHPSGDVTPSREDILITERIKEISERLDIQLLDHLIIGKNQIISLKEIGLI
ncbi:MAG: DNA repair protein RadC [Alphaproteobacteria bacterium]|nr:DNA repair protein RadC [Alphaproteobacteria bacterium]